MVKKGGGKKGRADMRKKNKRKCEEAGCVMGKGRREGGREGTNGPRDLEVTQMSSVAGRGRSLWRSDGRLVLLRAPGLTSEGAGVGQLITPLTQCFWLMLCL